MKKQATRRKCSEIQKKTETTNITKMEYLTSRQNNKIKSSDKRMDKLLFIRIYENCDDESR